MRVGTEPPVPVESVDHRESMEVSRFMPIVVPDHMRVGCGDERGQAAQEVERFEHQAGGPLRMRPGATQVIEDAPVITHRQAVLGG